MGLARPIPAVGVVLPRLPAHERPILNEEQIQSLEAVLTAHRLGFAFHLLISTGLRRGELLGLQWQDVDWTHRTLRIQHSLVGSGAKRQLQDPKTPQSRRAVVLSPGEVKRLQAYRAALAAEFPQGLPTWVFPSRRGTALDPRDFGRLFATVKRKAALPAACTVHDLRHTSASLLLAAGVHPRIVSERLGHANVTVTLNRGS